jgi:hypothetical protein
MDAVPGCPQGRSPLELDRNLSGRPWYTCLGRFLPRLFCFSSGRYPPIMGKVSVMMISKPSTGILGALALLLVLGSLAGPGVTGQARAQDKGTWQDLVFLYTSDIKGKIEPCG